MKQGKELKIKPEVRTALKKLGYTDYFTNIYISLLEFGEKNAHELSQFTKVPYSRIYEVLNEMVKRDIITKIDGRPSTFIANDPTEVFSLIKLNLEQNFRQNMSQALPYLKQLFGEKRQVKQELITVYKGEKACQEHLRAVINSTARSLDFAISNMKDYFWQIQSNLDFLKTKGVKFRMIIEDKYRHADFTKKLIKYGKVMFLPGIPQNLLVSDDKIATQGIERSINLTETETKGYTVFSSTSTMYVLLVSEIFNKYWKNTTQ